MTKLFSGHFSERWHAAPTPESPAPPPRGPGPDDKPVYLLPPSNPFRAASGGRKLYTIVRVGRKPRRAHVRISEQFRPTRQHARVRLLQIREGVGRVKSEFPKTRPRTRARPPSSFKHSFSHASVSTPSARPLPP